MSCTIKYRNNFYTPEEAAAIVSYHNKVYNDLLSSNLYSPANTKNHLVLPDDEIKFKESRSKIASVNSQFTESILKETKLNINKEIKNVVSIDVSPLDQSIINQFYIDEAKNRIEENKINANEEIIDGEVTIPTQYQRIFKGEFVNIDLFNKQADLMEEKFRNSGVNVKLFYDNTINESGKLLGVSDPKYKELVSLEKIKNGQPVIIVNPDKLYGDTIFHEYGHLFIDLIGQDNPRIQEAYKQLENSSISQEVRENYPELEGEFLQKEILATAIGRQADKIFGFKNDQNWFKRFQLWFKNIINNILGLSKDQVNELASELISKDKINIEGELSENTQFSKGSSSYIKKIYLKRDISDLNNIKKQISSLIFTQLKSLKRSNLDDKEQEYKENLTKFKKLFIKASDNETSKVILDYINYMDDRLKKYKIDIIDQVNISDLEIINSLNFVQKTLSSYSLIVDIDSAIDSGDLTVENFNSEEEFESIKKYSKELRRRVDDISASIKNKAIPPLARNYAAFSNRLSKKRRDELDVIFLNENPKKSNESSKEYNQRKQNFIDNKILEEKDEIFQKEVQFATRILKKSYDISRNGMNFTSEKGLNSAIIQLASKQLDNADTITDSNTMEQRNKINKLVKEFKKLKNSSNTKSQYKDFYEIGSDNQVYLTSQYSINFLLKYKSLKSSKERNKWFKENTTKNNSGEYIPIRKWINPNYNKIKDNTLYKEFISMSRDININKLKDNNSNISYFNNIEFHKLPNIGKEGYENISTGNQAKNAIESIKRIWQKRADDEEYGQSTQEQLDKINSLEKEINRRLKSGESVEDLTDEINMMKTITNEVGDIKQNIPIFYRGVQNLDDQSFDLPSIMMMDYYMAENYKQKNRIKNILELTSEVLKDKKYKRVEGWTKKDMYQVLTPGIFEEVKEKKGIDSNELLKFNSILANRLYGKKVVENNAKLANSLMGFTATTMLGLNYLAASANVVQGVVYKFIESHSNEFYNKSNLLNAEKVFFADTADWMDDIGKPSHTSKTNLLMNLFNIQGNFKALTNKFNEDNVVKTLMRKDTLFAMNHMGEFYLHGTLMYSIMDAIKVKNSNNEYIDKQGKVVSKDKAMNLHEAFSIENGQLKLNQYASFTSFGEQKFSLNVIKDKGVLEVRNLINKIANDMYGQYNDELQSHMQRHTWFKMFSMLRKWIVPLFNRRWRGAYSINTRKENLREDIDIYYSEDLQNYQEGYYTTFGRFITSAIKDFRQLDMSLKASFQNEYNKLNSHERANIRRTYMEMGIIALSYISSMLLYKLLDGIDEDDEDGLVYLAFTTRRLYNEMSFFYNPQSALQILSSPAASATYVENIIKLLGQIAEDGVRVSQGEGVELYERGEYKGMPKSQRRLYQILPILSQLKNLEKRVSREYMTFNN